MNKLRHMTLFMNIVDAGSITKAAEKLDLSKSVLSQHLKQLEDDLSTTLLKRTTRRQSLTPAGERFYQHCCEMHALSEQAWDEILEQQTEPTGTLTITAPHALMDTIVIPALTDTFSGHDRVHLNLICQDTQLDLMNHNIDLAIRAGESKDSNYKQKRLGAFQDVLCQALDYAKPLSQASYIANHWQPKHIEHTLFHKKTREQHLLHFEAKHKTNSVNQTAALIKAGFGIGVIPEMIMAEQPTLKAALPHSELPKVNVYALHPYQHSVPIAVTLAIKAIETHFSTWQKE